MHIVGEFDPDYRGYRQLVIGSVRTVMWYFRLAALLMLAWVAWGIAHGSSLLSQLYLVIPTVVLALVLELASLLGWRRHRRLKVRPWRYEITDELVAVHTPLTEVTVRRDAITKIITYRNVWVLKMATGTRMPVPRAAFTADERTQIDEWARASRPQVNDA
jgi:hypothetical protein